MANNVGIGTRVKHPTYGEGVIFKQDLVYYHIMFPGRGAVEIARNYDGLEVIEAVNQDESYITREYLENIIRQAIEEYTDITPHVPMGNKWIKGKLILQPSDEQLKPKEIPIEVFFHKIVMLRDRLRVLEQKINSHKGLSEEEKIDLQQYITRCYGSLTTFNVLFRDKKDWFVGEGDGT
ncbi:MAG: hypothetical protein IMW88_09625 [Thermoflavifilum sp.]|jgi:hypothetical protein|uniref:hypothetical protein n=1 Tax=Thermoflavifilum sp. TaxID=1968839 RepID=UPI0018A5994A|nr:hypothetical protein [Thermoflavifilum sp.]QOR75592.1 MAG: hypothetical protein IMW88_09625 [Thermoflavifilum sp.]